MNTKTQRTYDQVFQHPMTHNLEWRDVRALFEDVGDVVDEHNGNVKVTVSGTAVVFHSPTDSDIASPEQVSQIRHLLENKDGKAHGGRHYVVVIDHQEARTYRTEMKGAVPERVTPNDSDGHDRHVHSSHNYPGQDGQPNHDAYFKSVADNLVGADKILILGSGSGSSSTMELFAAWLKTHREKLADCLIGTVAVDQSHMTEGQLLARAREIYQQ